MLILKPSPSSKHNAHTMGHPKGRDKTGFIFSDYLSLSI
jgi:hypothetical protein